MGSCVHSALMAIVDALRALLQDWAVLEPRLNDQQLSFLARLSAGQYEPDVLGPFWILRDDELRHSGGVGLDDPPTWGDAGSADEVLDALAERVFATFALTVGPDHPAWSAWRESPIRFSIDQRPEIGDLLPAFGERAAAALSRREAEEDARADLLEEAVRRNVLRFGYAHIDGQQALESRAAEVPLIIVELNAQFAVPTFQLPSEEGTRRIVRDVNTVLQAWADPLGAASWWLSDNGWLGTLPAALLGTSREGEIALAADQLLSDSW